MAVSLLGTAGANAFIATLHFVMIALPSGLCQRHLKSSEIFVRRHDNTESLSDALRDTYKVFIESDGLLSSYSYQNSAHFQSVAIAAGNPQQKKSLLYTTVLFMAGQVMGLLELLSSDAENANRFRTGGLLIIICLYMGFIIQGTFKEDDAGCATVYFNATETNLVTSSDFALFASSERTEILIKWSVETLLLVVSGLFVWSSMLSNVATMIRNGGIGSRKMSLRNWFLIFWAIVIAIFCCIHIAILVQITKTRKLTVPSIEVQLAQAASDKDIGNADIIKFDVGKIIRKFANDVAKEFASSGKKWMADSGVYYDFAITGRHGGLVYGRMRASRSVNA
ncbi:hypothetical protein V1525DRAFT_414731 [Lipomyces kononenkoae]|uniref:Uncharacterized protein n=1 Tax=Lipomyces kononenkoae TaxID=34357 RepID=A0ACC3SRE5_LIPKO